MSLPSWIGAAQISKNTEQLDNKQAVLQNGPLIVF